VNAEETVRQQTFIPLSFDFRMNDSCKFSAEVKDSRRSCQSGTPVLYNIGLLANALSTPGWIGETPDFIPALSSCWYGDCAFFGINEYQ